MSNFTNTVIMIRPANFGFNAETAVNNAFQVESQEKEHERIRQKAIVEFDNMVQLLREEGIDVHVWNDSENPIKPDAVFPNNWFSTTPEGVLLTYPMYAANRRIERDEHIINYIEQQFHIERRYEFEHYEEKNQYLEGTGSMLFDHDKKVIYACLSPRTHIELLDKISILLGYDIVSFTSVDADGQQIYHTNVMMAMTKDVCIVCLDSIHKEVDKKRLVESIERGGRSVFLISYHQMNKFAGNMIQLEDIYQESILVMSLQAYESLTNKQVEQLSKSSKIVTPDISTIETYGGGSARCMIAEIFLEERDAIAG